MNYKKIVIEMIQNIEEDVFTFFESVVHYYKLSY